MSLVKVGTHFINTDLVQFTTEHQGVVLVHFAGQSPIRLSHSEWDAVARTMALSSPQEPAGLHAKIDHLTKLMNPEEDY